jgi:uncharacterized protein YcsI (UPF0317 family)
MLVCFYPRLIKERAEWAMTSNPVQQLDQSTSPAAVRTACRAGHLKDTTAGLSSSYAQANLVVVPGDLAFDFLVFCQRNPKPCPVLDVTEIGNAEPVQTAPGADLRTDLPRYRVYERGELVDEPFDISVLWNKNMAGFLLGCSFTFEQAMIDAGIPVRHIDSGRVVSMYRTNIPCIPAGPFHGNMVVSLRMIPVENVVRAVQVTSRFPAVHGAPVHIGNPADIGIEDLGNPDYGDPPVSESGDVPVFWACGVTPQAIAMQTRPELMITHAPGSMFVTDVPVSQLAVL